VGERSVATDREGLGLEASPIEAERGRLWSAVRESLAGSHRDYTEGPIGRAILLLAIPMVLELALESVFAVVDVFFVSRLGADAVATVGLTESMLIVIYAVAMGLSMGATAIVARRVGEKDRDGAARAAVQAIALGVLVAVPIGICGGTFARPLLRGMGATPGVVANVSYTTLMLGANGVIMMLFLINAVFRGAGDAAMAMRVLWLANAINICLDPCLILGLGVTGAAVATTTGRSVGVVVQLCWLARQEGRIAIRRAHLKLDPRVMVTMMRLSGSAVLQGLISNTSWVALVRILATFGSATLAGYTIAIRVVLFALLPAWGLANAAATLVGQNLGAGRPDRAATSAWRAGFYNMMFLGAVSLIFVAFAVPLVAVFTSDPAVGTIAVRGLRTISSGFVFYAYGMVLTQAFNGAGDTLTPTGINVFCFWLCEIPIAYALSHAGGLGPSGVFWSIAIAYSLMALISAALFKRGRWKLEKV
jgi:putative MATE family efflux protein